MKFAAALVLLVIACTLAAPSTADTLKNTVYRATIWVDPDGCQHWVMDTGLEGFMSLRLDRAGKPVCNKPLVIACKDPTKRSVFSQGQASCE
jgi:hypothetical protein